MLLVTLGARGRYTAAVRDGVQAGVRLGLGRLSETVLVSGPGIAESGFVFKARLVPRAVEI
jgi:hypothetical protein